MSFEDATTIIERPETVSETVAASVNDLFYYIQGETVEEIIDHDLEENIKNKLIFTFFNITTILKKSPPS